MWASMVMMGDLGVSEMSMVVMEDVAFSGGVCKIL